MKKPAFLVLGLGAATLLSGCADGLTPYTQSPDTVIATNHDRGHDNENLADGRAAVVYDPDGCQAWMIDDGLEGYAGRRYDPKSGLPICDKQYPPGTVVGDYQSEHPGITDHVPSQRRRKIQQ